MKRIIITSLFVAAICGAAPWSPRSGRGLAQVPMTGVGLGAPAGGGGGNPSVWNPSDKNANITLSTTTIANDTATTPSGGGSSWYAVRGTKSYATSTANKVVFALVTTKLGTAGNGLGWIGGVADGSVNLSNYIGHSSHSFATESEGGGDYQDGTGPLFVCSSGINPGQGVTVYYAVNFNNGHLFCSRDCVTWLAGGNPAADTGAPYTLSAATYFPAWAGGLDAGSDIVQLVTNPSLGGCSNLSGFTTWG
jgi:hypothetical protein